MAESVVAYGPRKIDLHELSTIFDPDVDTLNPNGELPNGKIIPVVSSMVIDKNANGALYWVSYVDPDTYKSTLDPVRVVVSSEDQSSTVSIVSYKNDIFPLFYDTRTAPTTLQPDRRLFIGGTNVANYHIVRGRGTSNEKVISRYYDTDGNFVDTKIPLIPVEATDLVGLWVLSECHTLVDMAINEILHIVVFNDHGTEVATVTVHSRPSSIINEGPGFKPVIRKLSVKSIQQLSNDEIYVMEKQRVDDIMLTAVLTYADGREVEFPIDGVKCKVYGLEDFIASYSGLRQPILVKYYLDDFEESEVTNSDRFISTEAYLVVVPNELVTGIKVSVFPLWNAVLGRYVLRYYAYTKDRDRIWDVTSHVTIAEGSFIGNLFGSQQSFVIQVDLTAADSTVFPEGSPNSPILHRQTVTIRVMPPNTLVRYILRDGPNSAVAYGADSATSRRPIIKYDTTRQQYFIPATQFPIVESMVKSFYLNATPPYQADAELGPLEPTHFIMRDVYSGTMVTPSLIPIEDYAVAFNIIGSPASRYSSATVIIEFLRAIDVDTTLTLYGVPVDVSISEGGYLG